MPALYFKISFMNDSKKKILLVWPPFTQYFELPLGIPSLVAYIKKNSFSDINILDLNAAYLKNNTFLYFHFTLNKKYLEISEKITYIKYNIKMYKCK